MTNPNDLFRKEQKVLWKLFFTGLVLPLLFGSLAFLGVLFIFQMEQNRWGWLPRIDFRHIPPEWIAYQQTAIFTVPVTGEPTCFAILDDSTFVIGTTNPHALSFFDMDGILLRKIDLPEEPRAIAIGTPETIFTNKIVIAYPRRIAVYNDLGDYEILWNLPGEHSNVRCFVLTPDYLFVADTGKRRIFRFDTEGNTNLNFAPVDGFVVYVSPIVMTFSPHTGLLYIANPGRHRVDVFTQDGDYMPELSWGEASASLSGFAGCCNPIGLAVLEDGRILTVEKAVSRIKIFRDKELDSVVAGWGILEHFPPEFGRLPMNPSRRNFSAIPLPEGRIAVFDFDYMAIRILERIW